MQSNPNRQKMSPSLHWGWMKFCNCCVVKETYRRGRKSLPHRHQKRLSKMTTLRTHRNGISSSRYGEYAVNPVGPMIRSWESLVRDCQFKQD